MRSKFEFTIYRHDSHQGKRQFLWLNVWHWKDIPSLSSHASWVCDASAYKRWFACLLYLQLCSYAPLWFPSLLLPADADDFLHRARQGESVFNVSLPYRGCKTLFLDFQLFHQSLYNINWQKILSNTNLYLIVQSEFSFTFPPAPVTTLMVN